LTGICFLNQFCAFSVEQIFSGQMFLALHQIDTGISVDLQVPRNYFWVTETKTNISLSLKTLKRNDELFD